MEEKEMINKMLKEGKISQKEADELLGALKESYGLDGDEEIDDYKTQAVEGSKSEKVDTDKDDKSISKTIKDSIFKPIKKNIDKPMKENIEKTIKDNIEKTVDNSTGVIEEIKSLFNGFFGAGYDFVESFQGKLTTDGPLIDLNNTNGKIKIKTWDKDDYKLDLNFTISADGENEAEKIKEEIFNLKQDEDKILLNIGNKIGHRISVDIFLSLPKYTVYEINAESTNGKIRLDSLQSKGLRVNTKNGKMTLNDIKGINTKVTGTNGKIYFSGMSENVFLKTTNGKITAEPSPGRMILEIKTTNGSQKVNLPDGAEYYVDSKVKLGSIGIALNNINWIKEKEKVVKKHYIVKSNNWNEEDEGIKVTARTTNGSINFSNSSIS
jgi:DUF4097 and DUF4098 domain-containing protein YvlB